MVINGTDGNDTITGTDGNDNITTGKGVDTVAAGGGDDQVYSESSGGTIDGGAGYDVYTGNFAASSAALTFDIGNTVQVSSGLTASNFEVVYLGGSGGSDVFNLNRLVPGTLYGGAGFDTLVYNGASAMTGQDFVIRTSLGVGQFSGGISSPELQGSSTAFQEFEKLSIAGGQFDDEFDIAGFWDSSLLSIDGGGGNDRARLDLRAATAAINFVVAADGTTSGNVAQFTNVENFSISGSENFADTIVTGSGNDALGGGGGDDSLSGGGGDDTLAGGSGADTLLGGDGKDLFYGDDPNSFSADVMRGGAGDDLYSQVDGLDTIVEEANGGYDTVEAFADTVLPDNVEALTLLKFVPWPLTPATSGTGNALDNAITGNDLDNILSGLGGNDTIVGGYGQDTIIGGTGADVLTGGNVPGAFNLDASADLFKGTAAEFNGDTITDFTVGDKIVITDANIAGFSFSLSGTSLSYTGGSLTLSGPVDGRISASAAAGGGVQLTIVPRDVHNDFNADGQTDFILRDTQSGWLTDWRAFGEGKFVNNGALTSLFFSADWKVAGTGDFNGDGRDDFLLRNDSGWLTNWLGASQAEFTNNGANASLFFAPEWKVSGTGDYNGDGRSDLLLRRDDGWLTNWLGTSTGSFTNNGANTSLFFTTDWKVISTGDFNGDGISDLLLRRDDGWLTDWLGTPDGGFTNNGANTSLFFTADWKVIGTGDFNGDKIDDLLLRRDDGWITDWLGNANGGFTNNGSNTALFLSTDWKISSIGDFNNDGREDILLRHDSGWMTNWLGTAAGSFSNNGANFSTFIAPNWVVQDPFM